jgi:hypothetical protein
MAKTITLRYPFNGDVYTAEGAFRIRVEHEGEWGYFDDRGRWLEGALKIADPTFCRFLSSSFMVEEAPDKWGVVSKKTS